MEDLHIAVEFDERAIRALHCAVSMTLEKWTGQGEVDQDTTSGNLFSQRSGSNSGITWRYNASTEEIQFFYGEGIDGFNSGTDSVPLNTWTHVALTRSGNTFTHWVGGQSGGTNTITASMGYTRPRIGTAVSQPNEYYKGYIDDFRITKGVARYTASFTPPTAQFEHSVRGFKASGVWTIPEVSRLRRTFVCPGTNAIVSDGLVLNLDAGNTNSYPGTGTTWTDLSGNGNNGTLQNGASYVSGNGGAISFDGSNDRVVIPNDTALDTQTPSVEVWVKVDTLIQDGFFFEKGDVNTQYALFIQDSFQSSPQIQWRVKSAGFNDVKVTASTYIDTSSYAQIVGTYTSGSRKLYINGSLVASDSATGTIPSNSGGMSVGVYGGFNGPYGYYLDGAISIVRVYDRVLTAGEITQNYNANRGRYGL